MSGTSTRNKPVLIIGAGVVGLTLAHALNKAHIPFEVYERDDHIDARGQGWAITLHWALDYLHGMLDEATISAVDDAQVDPEVGRNDTGNFLFLNLQTLETKFRIPPNTRRRVHREKLRRALLRGVAGNVNWGKKLSDIELLEDSSGGGVRATFADRTVAEGAVLVGAEGSNSRTRQFLVPEDYRNRPVPVNFFGAAVRMTAEQVAPLRQIDPLLFQGCHPETGDFLWISILETPDTNGSRGAREEYFLVQVIQSWANTDVGGGDHLLASDERLVEMKRRAARFHPLLRDVVDGIPGDASIVEVAVQDWPCLKWDNYHGRVTLAGDAAHAMTMYRGEAANHGILDAHYLRRALENVYRGEASLKTALDVYEKEMRERTTVAVDLSREAALDAHDFHGLNENSAVLRRRAIQQS